MKSANAIVQALLQENVEVLFGIPSFLTIPIYDVLYHTKEIRHVLVRHEQAASFMAYAYGMVTGKPGTVLIMDGPAATNIMTGMADAYTGSIPLVAIIGKIHSNYFGKGAAHELDSTLFKPITKEIIHVSEPGEIFPAIHKAYAIAVAGRKGPVCLEIPTDLMNMEVSPEERGKAPERRDDIQEGAAPDIKKAAKLLASAKKPLLLAGGGAIASGASQELIELAEFLGIPVAVSHMGRGVIPDDHHLALGLFRNNPILVNFIQQSDVVLAVGFKFSQISTFSWTLKVPQKLIHIDVDPRQIGKNYPAEIPIVGDAKQALRSLLDAVKNEVKKRKPEEYPRLGEVTEWKNLLPLRIVPEDIPIKPLRLIKGIRNCLDRDAIVATDVGNSFFWALFFLEMYLPRTLLCSSSFSTMGCGLPIAIGAKLTKPEKQVMCLTGDGGFLMNNQELATAIENKLAIPIVIMNDSGYGAIRHIQDRICQGRYIASSYVSPDFVLMARAFGVEGILITKPEEIEPALRAALKSDRPTILDVRVDGTEKLPQNRLPSEA